MLQCERPLRRLQNGEQCYCFHDKAYAGGPGGQQRTRAWEGAAKLRSQAAQGTMHTKQDGQTTAPASPMQDLLLNPQSSAACTTERAAQASSGPYSSPEPSPLSLQPP
eukprot:CAMPEP_0184287970 /NCGR_PEP_ID=MMETSP1049-20130417/413_1 /TAXON_ID=77928 /ORGANISM="Proteomonas sulcata, Strain CCMP704" /LENGTH=107 /DNA_ID=CAMNT_0026594115 /DNA_START=999 /DNA_END=1323 /DNA_ORIENTATION=+